jgi:D-arabinose 1-dehydrogenase-like Zn-dependent alcohol dehydrogenase
VIGASGDPVAVLPPSLIRARRSVQGWPSGIAADSADTLAVSPQSGVRPIIETMPLERAPRSL